jgi:predicted nucleic acid-binding protein
LPAQFTDRVLPIDARTAAAWGALDAEATRDGRPLGVVDGLLLATAQSHGLVFVTRNVAHCTDRGVTVIDPWAG